MSSKAATSARSIPAVALLRRAHKRGVGITLSDAHEPEGLDRVAELVAWARMAGSNVNTFDGRIATDEDRTRQYGMSIAPAKHRKRGQGRTWSRP